MPKNKGKGGKNRRRGKNENESEKRELLFKEDEQEYAQVTKMLGNGRLEAMCFDGVKRLCHIRGKLRKKVSGAENLLRRRISKVKILVVLSLFFKNGDFLGKHIDVNCFPTQKHALQSCSKRTLFDKMKENVIVEN